MNVLLFIGIYLLIGILFSRFIKWGNTSIVEANKRIELGNIEYHALTILWPMFLVIFIFQFIKTTIKKIISKL